MITSPTPMGSNQSVDVSLISEIHWCFSLSPSSSLRNPWKHIFLKNLVLILALLKLNNSVLWRYCFISSSVNHSARVHRGPEQHDPFGRRGAKTCRTVMARPLFNGEVVAFLVVYSRILHPQALSPSSSLAMLAVFSGMLSATCTLYFPFFEIRIFTLDIRVWWLEGKLCLHIWKKNIFRCLISKP